MSSTEIADVFTSYPELRKASTKRIITALIGLAVRYQEALLFFTCENRHQRKRIRWAFRVMQVLFNQLNFYLIISKPKPKINKRLSGLALNKHINITNYIYSTLKEDFSDEYLLEQFGQIGEDAHHFLNHPLGREIKNNILI
jgi:hypothetical protein